MWGTPNELFRAVLNDLREDKYVTCCRALGLVAKFITGPWQRLVESDFTILALNKHFEQGMNRLCQLANNSQLLVSGDAPPLFDAVPLKKDEIFTSLTTSKNDDKETAAILEKIISGFITVCNRQLADQLQGGEHYSPSDDLLKQAESCSATNISGERVFGKLDFQLRHAPNSSLDFKEAKIMFQENRTNKWLTSKTPEERTQLI